MKKPLPDRTSDDDAERFIETGDLSQFDLSVMRPHNFEFAPKSKQGNMRFPEPLLNAVKSKAAEHGMSYQRFVRQVLEAAAR